MVLIDPFTSMMTYVFKQERISVIVFIGHCSFFTPSPCLPLTPTPLPLASSAIANLILDV